MKVEWSTLEKVVGSGMHLGQLAVGENGGGGGKKRK